MLSTFLPPRPQLFMCIYRPRKNPIATTVYVSRRLISEPLPYHHGRGYSSSIHASLHLKPAWASQISSADPDEDIQGDRDNEFGHCRLRPSYDGVGGLFDGPRLPELSYANLSSVYYPSKVLAVFLGTRNRKPGPKVVEMLAGYLSKRDGSVAWIFCSHLIRTARHKLHVELEQVRSSTEEQWKCIMGRTPRKCPQDVLDRWTWVLDPDTWDERIHRFLCVDAPRPVFLLNLMVHNNVFIHDVDVLQRLVEYFKRSYCDLDSPPLSTDVFLELMCRLIEQVRRTDPAAVIKLAVAIGLYLRHIPPRRTEQERFAVRTRLFNYFLDEISLNPDLATLRARQSQWEAQQALLKSSQKYDRPLLLGDLGLRAIRRVLAGLVKSPTEIYVAGMAAQTFPPFRKAQDGMDEKIDPENLISRASAAGVAARAAGYPDTPYDRALDTMAGGAPGSLPATQIRTVVPEYAMIRDSRKSIRNRYKSLPTGDRIRVIGEGNQIEWIARVAATRNATEAWIQFNNPSESLKQSEETCLSSEPDQFEAKPPEMDGAARELTQKAKDEEETSDTKEGASKENSYPLPLKMDAESLELEKPPLPLPHKLLRRLWPQEPSVEVYAQMLKKLVAKYAEHEGLGPDTLPGDHPGIVFRADRSNMSDYEVMRTTPPSLRDLFDRMRGRGIPANRSILWIIISYYASSFDEALYFLMESGVDGYIAAGRFLHRCIGNVLGDDHTLPGDGFSLAYYRDAMDLQRIHPGLFVAVIKLACRLQASYLQGHHPKDPESAVASKYIRVALHLIRLRQGYSKIGSHITRRCWHEVLRRMSRSEIFVSAEAMPGKAAAALQLSVRMYSHFVTSHSVDATTFAHLCRAVENFAFASLACGDRLLPARDIVWRAFRTMHRSFDQLTRRWKQVPTDVPLESDSALLSLKSNAIHRYMCAMGLVGGHELRMAHVTYLAIHNLGVVRWHERWLGHPHPTLYIVCAFRAFAEPVLTRYDSSKGRRLVAQLQADGTAARDLWWPTDDQVSEYLKSKHWDINWRRTQELLHQQSWWASAAQAGPEHNLKYARRHRPLGEAVVEVRRRVKNIRAQTELKYSYRKMFKKWLARQISRGEREELTDTELQAAIELGSAALEREEVGRGNATG